MNKRMKTMFGAGLLIFLVFTLSGLADPYIESSTRKGQVYSLDIGSSQAKETGREATLTGTIETYFIENFEESESEMVYHLTTSTGQTFNVFFEENQNLVSGTEVSLQGILAGNDLLVSKHTVLSEPENSLRSGPSSIGEQKLLVVLVNFQENRATPITLDEASNRVFNEENPDSINYWLRTTSFGQTWLSGDVMGWVEMPFTQAQMCEVATLRREVISRIDSEVDFNDYTRIMVVYPYGTSCNYSGIAFVGSPMTSTGEGTMPLSISIINGVNNVDGGTGAHEFGHNLGLFHANDLECGETSISLNGCQSISYGDDFDIMGAAYRKGYPNAKHMEVLGWLNNNQILELTTGDSGVYRIYPIEAETSGLKALKLPATDNLNNNLNQSDLHYYVEFRRPIEFDAGIYNDYGANVYSGAMIHLYQPTYGSDTHLIDNSPHVTGGPVVGSQFADSLYTVVPQGQTFTDPSTEVSVTVLSVTSSYMDVQVSVPQLCGNNRLDFGEQCDGSLFTVSSCSSLSERVSSNLISYDGGNLSCSNSCTFDSTQCTVGASCPWDQDGDGVVNPADRGFVSVQIGCAVGTGSPLCDLADINRDGHVTAGDRGFIGANLGVCPA